MNLNDWEKCDFGENMEVLGINNYLCRNTLVGDWDCTTYDTKTKEPIGEFCTDTGMVGVFLLDEVLKYNPEFNYHIEKPWTTTWIKNFDGEIEIVVEKNEYGEKEVRVVGNGNINFYTQQTGF